MELADEEMQSLCPEKAAGPIRINLKKEAAINVEPVQVVFDVDEPEPEPVAAVLFAAPIPCVPKTEPNDVVYFSTGEDPIEITNQNPITLTNCSTYDAELNKIGLYWDMLIVNALN